MEDNSFFAFATLVLTTVTLCIAISTKLRLGTVVGFIIAGVTLGPYTPGLVATTNIELLQQIADFGVVLFLFTIGLEIKPKDLWGMKKSLLTQGLGQVLAIAIIFSLLGYLFGFAWEIGFTLGLIFGQSSTAVVMTMLKENNELNTLHGKNIFTNLMGQDISIVPVMALLPILAHQVSSNSSGTLISLLLLISVALSILVIGRYLLPIGLRWSARAHSREGFMLCLFVSIFATVWVVDKVGLSATLGAFLLGICLSNSSFRFAVENIISPFKGVLMGLLFISVGMSINLGLILTNYLDLILFLIIVIPLKSIVFYVLARLDRQSKHTSIKTAFALSQVGEFAFVLLGVAASLGILNDAYAALGIIIASVSMAITPWIYKLGNYLAIRSLNTEQSTQAELENEVDGENNQLVIIGLDEVGRLMATLADRAQISYIAFDSEFDRVKSGKNFGLNVHFGDIMELGIQDRANLNQAKAVFISVENSGSLRKICLMLSKFKQLDIYARTNSRVDEFFLKEHGIQYTGSVYIESTLLRGRDLLLNFGLQEEEVFQLIDEVKSDLFERDYLNFKSS